MKYIVTVLLSILVSVNTLASNLKDVLSYAVENAPQFKESEFYTQSQIANLNKVLSIYDTYLNLSYSDYKQDSSIYSNSKDRGKVGSASLSKNIGLGTSVGLSYDTSDISSTSDSYEASIKVSAEIDLLKNFLGKIDKTTVLISDKNKEILDLTLSQSRESLVYGIVIAYINQLRLEELIIENKELLKSIIVLEKATIKKQSLGASEKRYVLQMTAKRVDTEIKILELERLLSLSKDNLYVLVGGKSFENLSPIKMSKYLTVEVKDIQTEKLKVEQARLRAELESAENNMLPSLKFEVGYEEDNTNSDSMKYIGDMDESAKYAMLSISMPLERNSEKSTRDIAKYSLAETDNKLKTQELEFKRQLQEYKKSIDNYSRQVKMSVKARDLQERRYVLELKAYNQGRSGINDINTAQNEMISAKITAVEKLTSFHKYGAGNLYINNQLESFILGK